MEEIKNNEIEEQVIEEAVKTAEQLERELADEKKRKKKKWLKIWDKFTTGILILLMASPVLVLGWIFCWFLLGQNF